MSHTPDDSRKRFSSRENWFPSAPGKTTASESSRVEDVLAEQRAGWLTGQGDSVETLLERHPSLAENEEGLLDLIYAEYALREELGDSPDENEYIRRFPQFSRALKRQFQLDRLLWGDIKSSLADNPASPASVPLPESLGKYKILSLLDQGGQTLVYRGVHPGLNKDVVIKVSHPTQLASRNYQYLRQEGQILANLSHPNLVQVYDLDVDQDRLFLVMEYIRGQTLLQRFAQGGCSPGQAVDIVTQMAQAVGHIHNHGILHLDICPNNVILEDGQRIKLIDFGLVRFLQWFKDHPDTSPSISGTPEFMAPEQARGDKEHIGPHTDIFALGAVLYFLLTGRAPFNGPHLADVLDQARQCRFDQSSLFSPAIPKRLARLCLRCMDCSPENRPVHAEQLLSELQDVFRGKQSRVKVWVAVAGSLLLVLLVGIWQLDVGSVRSLLTQSTRSEPKSSGPIEKTEATIEPPLMQVRVWTPQGYRPLQQLTPLQTGDHLQIEVDCPASLHMGLYLFNTEGKLRLLAQKEPGPDPSVLKYPPNTDVPLQGKPGTELLLVLGRKDGFIHREELQNWLPEDQPLAKLPGYTVLRLEREKIVFLQKDRDFGPPRQTPHPETLVVRRLEELRKELQGVDYFEGLAFSHE